jgi:AcrR family transcriptional regulator
MSRRPIENIDEKIILATIDVAGGTMEPNRFSTKEVAAKAGCSEFVIYSHFKTKDNLIARTNAYTLKVFCERAELAIAKSPTLVETFLTLLEEAIAYPTVTDFCVNYAHIFPRAKAPSDYEGYKAHMNILCSIFAKAYPFGEADNTDLTRYLLMAHFLRELVVSAKTIIHHEIKDTPAIRLSMARNAVYGLTNYEIIEK